MIRRPPRSTQSRSSAASDVYKRDQRGGLALGDVPLQAVVELLEDELSGASQVGRQEVVQLAGVAAREGLEHLALIDSSHDLPPHAAAVRLRWYTARRPATTAAAPSVPVSYTHL